MGKLGLSLLVLGLLGISMNNCSTSKKFSNSGMQSEIPKNYNNPSNREYKIKFNNFSEPLPDEAKNEFDSLDNKILKVHFQTNKYNLTKGDSSDLRGYFCELLRYYHLYKPYEPVLSITCEGFADFRPINGNPEANNPLSFNRAMTVAEFAVRFFPKAKIYIAYFGETRSRETTDTLLLQKDRVVKIIINKNPVKRAIEYCEGNVFLGDGTGSLNECYFKTGECQWPLRLLRECSFPDSIPMYKYSEKLEDNLCEKYTENELPSGKTAHLLSLEELINLRSERDNITTIVHGEDTFGKVTLEEVLETAKEKQTMVNNIGIDLSENYQKILRRISRETGGKYYFFKRFN